jgi:hypothetical protein
MWVNCKPCFEGPVIESVDLAFLDHYMVQRRLWLSLFHVFTCSGAKAYYKSEEKEVLPD